MIGTTKNVSIFYTDKVAVLISDSCFFSFAFISRQLIFEEKEVTVFWLTLKFEAVKENCIVQKKASDENGNE